MRLGTLVTSPNFRHPALLAKDVMTLDQISGGRFELGIGAGGTGMGRDGPRRPAPTLAERAGRFEDFTAALDAMLREPSGSYAGPGAFRRRSTARCRDASQRPRVPFTIAGRGAAGAGGGG